MTELEQFRWEDYLEFSQKIQNKKYFLDEFPNINQAIKRTVVSRTYYSAYHVICEFVNYKPTKGSDSPTMAYLIS